MGNFISSIVHQQYPLMVRKQTITSLEMDRICGLLPSVESVNNLWRQKADAHQTLNSS